MSEAPHIPVLLDEVLQALEPAPGLLIVDGTFGAGGYSRALLAAGARVVAFDRDPSVSALAADLADDPQFRLIHAPFSAMADELGDSAVEGVALDLGVSSMQMDQAERGFSLMRDGPLDMRMSGEGPTAADLVNTWEPGDLVRVFREYGEEWQARRVVAAIVRRRTNDPFVRTLDLAQVVEKALGGRRGARLHPATRVFQGLRIAVNQELSELEDGLLAAERVLKVGGRLAVVSFHSLEDRIVKTFFAKRSGRTGAVSRHAPLPESGPPPSFELITGGVIAPSEAEVARNPRARSAKLRYGVRTAAPVFKEAA